jgi:hypothetical protein
MNTEDVKGKKQACGHVRTCRMFKEYATAIVLDAAMNVSTYLEKSYCVPILVRKANTKNKNRWPWLDMRKRI